MLIMLVMYYVIAFIFLMLTCYRENLKRYHVVSKCLCSLGFLLVAVLGKIKSPDSLLFWRLFLALFLCFLGDYFLAKQEKVESERLFLLGLFSFLLGHCTFLFAFCYVRPWNGYTLIVPFLGVLLAIGLLRLKYMRVGTLKLPVLIYAYFVTALFVECTQVAVHGNGSVFYVIVFLGGLLFLISDEIILFLYFYKVKYGIMKFLNLFTYYSATFLLGLSIFYS
ncbi:MAG: lysoplasmalogenase family protein [Velocimicrobium sp.]